MLMILALEILHSKFPAENKNISKNKPGFDLETAKEKSAEEISKEKHEKIENLIILLPLLVTLLGIIVMQILNIIFG